MRKFMAAVLAGVLAMGILASPARAQDPAAWKDFQNLMNSAAWGFTKMDGVGFLHLALPEATLRYADGTSMTIEEWKKKAAVSFEATAVMRAAFRLLEVEVEAPRAKITYSVTLNYRLKADMEPRYQSTSRWSAMLIKTPKEWSNGWRVKQFMQLSEEITRDGNPLPPNVSPPRW